MKEGTKYLGQTSSWIKNIKKSDLSGILHWNSAISSQLWSSRTEVMLKGNQVVITNKKGSSLSITACKTQKSELKTQVALSGSSKCKSFLNREYFSIVSLGCTHSEDNWEFTWCIPDCLAMQDAPAEIQPRKNEYWQSTSSTCLLFSINWSGTVSRMHICLRMPQMCPLADCHHTALGFTAVFLDLIRLQSPWNCSNSLTPWLSLVREKPIQHRTTLGEYGAYFNEFMNYTADLISLNAKIRIWACTWNVNQCEKWSKIATQKQD